MNAQVTAAPLWIQLTATEIPVRSGPSEKIRRNRNSVYPDGPPKPQAEGEEVNNSGAAQQMRITTAKDEQETAGCLFL